MGGNACAFRCVKGKERKRLFSVPVQQYETLKTYADDFTEEANVFAFSKERRGSCRGLSCASYAAKRRFLFVKKFYEELYR